jgi:hypothetical protein
LIKNIAALKMRKIEYLKGYLERDERVRKWEKTKMELARNQLASLLQTFQ